MGSGRVGFGLGANFDWERSLADFLPLKCDACEEVFCKDHITYKDVQVPICPLYNIPVPVRRGEMPDVVGAHIDRDCKYDPAQQKWKIFINKCFKSGCKKKEMMKLVCDQCHGNFCIKHQHPLDHDGKGSGHAISKVGQSSPFCLGALRPFPVAALQSGGNGTW
uniref:AN1-type domain-containing protein n=1 Tax=Sphenodon punctatus TaxID=8508 RepID=A0A8D0HSD0_SPHPU